MEILLVLLTNALENCSKSIITIDYEKKFYFYQFSMSNV